MTDLGASLYEILTIIRMDRTKYPKVDFYFDKSHPLDAPSLITLPQQGLRFRFDGADQRLRLIEIMDFKLAGVVYKGNEIMRGISETDAGPSFRRIYQLFGPTYAGEYFPPDEADVHEMGQYILSWEGLAVVFPMLHSAWTPEKDHVSILGSAISSRMAVFEGGSWPEVRDDLFVRIPAGPRLSGLITRSKDNLPAELELAEIQGQGTIQFRRREPAPPFALKVNESFPQDLISWLGRLKSHSKPLLS